MNEKQQAESLFLNSEKSQKEIASQLGIDPKTLYRWIKEGHWQQLKSATRRMPSILVENIYEQLDDLNYNISQRERGQRHPTKDESLTISRLTHCINKVQKQTSQGQNIQFMMNFIDYVQPLNHDLAQLLTHYGSAFLNGSQIKGFHPYDIEYNNATQSAGEAPSLFLGKVPEGGKGPLAPDYNPNQLELPFPDNTSLSFGEGRGEASHEIGHESGIEKNKEIPTQQIENQTEEAQTPEIKMPEMPGNNLPGNRASQETPHSFHNVTLSLGDSRAEASLALDNSRGQNPQSNESTNEQQQLSSGETQNTPFYYRKCIQDPNDPYTFYYDKITKRTINSPKYGKPPDGFREVPKKDCLDRTYGKGFGRYNW